MSNRDLSKYNYITKEDYQTVAGPDWPSYNDFQLHNNVEDFVYDEIDTMLSDVKPFSHPTFCVLPFYGWEYPQNSACCLLPRKHNLEQIKSQMLEGIRPPECHQCWSNEDHNIKSDRLLKNEGLDYYFDINLETLYNQARQGKNSVVHYKIDTSNTCNATCVTCGSYASSAWAQLERKNNQVPQKGWRATKARMDSIIDYSTAKSIAFRGGEPFLSSTNFYILEQLISHNNLECFISFTTNGSSKVTEYQKNILSNFKNVNFCFSIDGIGTVFEYMRYPLKWSELLENLEYCRNNKIMSSVSYTISNVNIMYHEETTKWFSDNNLSYRINEVYSPAHFTVSALNENIKKYLLNLYPNSSINHLLKTHTKNDDYNYSNLLKEISKQDQWKGISIQNYLPEFAELLRKYPK